MGPGSQILELARTSVAEPNWLVTTTVGVDWPLAVRHYRPPARPAGSEWEGRHAGPASTGRTFRRPHQRARTRRPDSGMRRLQPAARQREVPDPGRTRTGRSGRGCRHQDLPVSLTSTARQLPAGIRTQHRSAVQDHHPTRGIRPPCPDARPQGSSIKTRRPRSAVGDRPGCGPDRGAVRSARQGVRGTRPPGAAPVHRRRTCRTSVRRHLFRCLSAT
jgi:hypothetical protein